MDQVRIIEVGLDVYVCYLLFLLIWKMDSMEVVSG